MTDHNYPPDPFNEWRESVLKEEEFDYIMSGCPPGKIDPTWKELGDFRFLPSRIVIRCKKEAEACLL